MLLHKWKILRTKNICIFLQCILLTLFVSTALAKPSCQELVNPLKKNTDNIALIKQSRLSVMQLTKSEFKIILRLGNTKLPGL